MTGLSSGRLSNTHTVCPECAMICDGYGFMGGEAPKPSAGDVTVCLHCSSLVVFDGEPDALILRHPNDAEIVDLAGNPDVITMMTLVGGFRESERVKALRLAAGDDEDTAEWLALAAGDAILRNSPVFMRTAAAHAEMRRGALPGLGGTAWRK